MAHSPLSSAESNIHHAIQRTNLQQKAASGEIASSPTSADRADSDIERDDTTSSWKFTNCSRNAFMHESFLDEMAASGGTDPMTLRRKLMAPYPVAIKLLDAIAAMSAWDTALPAGSARGLTFGLTSGTWLAEVVEVSRQRNGIRIDKFYCAADAGYIADEQSYRAQMISGIVAGLSSVTGAGPGGQFAFQCPEIEVELLSNSKRIDGNTQPATPLVIAALANAVSALTGKRLHRERLFEGITFI